MVNCGNRNLSRLNDFSGRAIIAPTTLQRTEEPAHMTNLVKSDNEYR
jgi:hypothetical protein